MQNTWLEDFNAEMESLAWGLPVMVNAKTLIEKLPTGGNIPFKYLDTEHEVNFLWADGEGALEIVIQEDGTVLCRGFHQDVFLEADFGVHGDIPVPVLDMLKSFE